MFIKNENKQGFTIVELLIVIVVIGILAAITIVAFNGIQQRARNTQTQQAAAAYARALVLHAQDKGSYPLPAYFTCLGAGYTTTEKCDGNANLADAETVMTALNEYLPGKPQPALTNVGGRRGILYHFNGSVYYILFIQEGTTSCPNVSGTIRNMTDSVATGGVFCRASLPVL